MLKFNIILYLVPNLAQCITFVNFNAKFSIALKNIFYAKMLNFDIDTQIWHCSGDALSLSPSLYCSFPSSEKFKTRHCRRRGATSKLAIAGSWSRCLSSGLWPLRSRRPTPAAELETKSRPRSAP